MIASTTANFPHFFRARPLSATTKTRLMFVVLLALALMIPLMAMAGTGGNEFDDFYNQISGWANGTLGKTLGVAALIVGLGIGVVSQSVMAAAVGIAVALVAGLGPNVIDALFTNAVTITTPII